MSKEMIKEKPDSQVIVNTDGEQKETIVFRSGMEKAFNDYPKALAIFGTKARTCKELNISYSTVMDWQTKSPEFKEECHKAMAMYNEDWKDRFEDVVDEKVFVDKDNAIIIKAMNRARDRGYGDKQEIELSTSKHEDLLSELE